MEPDPNESPTEPPSTPAPEPAAPEPTPALAPAPGPGSGSGGGSGSGRRPPPLPQLVTELHELVVTYVKQQTLIPLKQLGRYVGFGVLGSLLLGFGVVFLALSGLRALQTETSGTFAGDWSWVPYVLMVFVLIVGAVVVWLLRTATR